MLCHLILVVTFWALPCDPLTGFAGLIARTPWAAQAAVLPDGDGAEVQARGLERRIQDHLAAVIIYGDMQPYGDYVGVTLRDSRHILVRQDLGWDAKLLVLAHEAGHLLHPPTLTDEESEAFAEGVSWLVGRRLYGTFADEAHRRYLTRYKAHLGIWRTFRPDIDYAVTLLAPRPPVDWGPAEPFLPAVDLEQRWPGRSEHGDPTGE